MFTPPGQDPAAVRTILFVFLIAMLASICSQQMAHGAERFLAGERQAATVSLRPDAAIAGREIRLRQIARWSDTDKAAVDPIADLVVARFDAGQGFRTLELGEVKTLLRDAGVNLATLDFVGPTACRVERADATFAEGQALEQYTAATTKQATTIACETSDASGRTLKQALVDDLAVRLHLNATDLQVTFKADDEAALRRREPHDTFDIRPQRAGDLGDVSWVVSVSNEKRLFVTATARAWQTQTVASAPLALRQPITAADVTERRQLVDRLSPDAVLPVGQVVGQAAAREIKPGMVVTAHMVSAVELVQSGQDVTVDTSTGGVRLISAARALSAGTLGQTVRLRNEQTRQTFVGTVTGPKRVSLAGAMTAVSVR